MGYGGGEETASLSFVVAAGLPSAQPDPQPARKMSGTLGVAEQEVVELVALLNAFQPVLDDIDTAALQYRAHSYLVRPDSRFAAKHLFADELSEFFDFEWFHENFVRFQKDSVYGALHVGVAADDQRKCIRWEWRIAETTVKPSPGSHVQVTDEHVKTFRGNASQSFSHACGKDNVKSLPFKRGLHHGANVIIVIHQQHFMHDG